MPRFSSRMIVGARGTHTPRLVAAGSHDPLWDARGVQPVHIRCPQYLPGEDGSNVLSGHAMRGRWGLRECSIAGCSAAPGVAARVIGEMARAAYEPRHPPCERAHPVVRKDPGRDQRTFSFLPAIRATVEPDQTGRPALDALRLWTTGLRPVLARLDLATAAERPELAGAILPAWKATPRSLATT
jgi:hypothetical protein